MAPIPNAQNAWRLAQITFGPAPLSVHRTGTLPSDIVDRTGEDLMLTDALAFDVRLYDPGVPVYRSDDGSTVLEPGDLGWPYELAPDKTDITLDPSLPSVMGFGAYVDLGWGVKTYPGNLVRTFAIDHRTMPGIPRAIFGEPRQVGFPPRFQQPLSPLPARPSAYPYPYGYPAVYDTWSLHYESDGIDQDPDNENGAHPRVLDQGTNGIDDWVFYPSDVGPPPVMDQRDGPDDVGERETSPPYDAPLRGVQVRLRLYERSARQIRETSVTQSLVP
jgi:hypothetical protein